MRGTKKRPEPPPKAAAPSPGSRLIWDRVVDSTPRRKARYDEITTAAMALADKGGLEAVSLRGLADSLSSGTMTLYRYVSTKVDIWDLMLDSGFRTIPLAPQAARNWQESLLAVMTETRKTLLAHAWLIPLVTARPPLGPGYLAWFEHLLSTCAAAAPRMRDRLRMIGALWAYTSGFVAYELGDRKSNTQHGLSEEKKQELVAPYLIKVLQTGRFPHLRMYLSQRLKPNADHDFERGIRALLRGMQNPKPDAFRKR